MKPERGFALPTILIASIVLMMLLAVAMRVSSSIKDSIYDLYYNQLAIAARDAGIAYAGGCLDLGAGKPTWDSAGDGGADALTPANNCAGTAISGASTYLVNTSTVRTTFSVPRTPVDSGGYATQIRATGTVQLLNSAGVVYRTISQPTPPALGSVTRYAVTTLAGSGSAGSANGTGTGATFNTPWGVVWGTDGNLYESDVYAHLIRKITPAGVVTTFAGNGTAGHVDATGTSAQFNEPELSSNLDASGNMYVMDVGSNYIRKITPAGVVTTFAGNGTAGSTNGATPTTSSFNNPRSIVFDSVGNAFIVDQNNQQIRKITPAGVVSQFAGGGSAGGKATGHADGTGVAATFYTPDAIVIDTDDNLYITDRTNNEIRKITPAGVVTTLAGQTTAGEVDGVGGSAKFNAPIGMVFHNGYLYVSELSGNNIRRVSLTGVVTTIAGGGSVGGSSAGSANGTNQAATFKQPVGLTFDDSGNMYVGDSGNFLVRKITLQY